MMPSESIVLKALSAGDVTPSREESAVSPNLGGVVPCSRCHRADGTHIGYHEASELPFRRGDRVSVRASAALYTILPNPEKRVIVNKRARTIVVQAHPEVARDPRNWGHKHAPTFRCECPEVVWPGTGGYWHRAKISDCELILRP